MAGRQVRGATGFQVHSASLITHWKAWGLLPALCPHAVCPAHPPLPPPPLMVPPPPPSTHRVGIVIVSIHLASSPPPCRPRVGGTTCTWVTRVAGATVSCSPWHSEAWQATSRSRSWGRTRSGHVGEDAYQGKVCGGHGGWWSWSGWVVVRVGGGQGGWWSGWVVIRVGGGQGGWWSGWVLGAS